VYDYTNVKLNMNHDSGPSLWMKQTL